ncbi:MAG: TonB C-terminal domain-containing protein [Vampirovibrionales bacterium]|nr:TonB C-terminal domain-containing protein [Vampirovibrionales bacterium]
MLFRFSPACGAPPDVPKPALFVISSSPRPARPAASRSVIGPTRLMAAKSLQSTPFKRALGLSAAIHAALTLMLALAPLLSAQWRTPPERAMEFTLAQTPSQEAPRKASFFGEKNQQAGNPRHARKQPQPPENASKQTLHAPPPQPAPPVQPAPKPPPQSAAAPPTPQPVSAKNPPPPQPAAIALAKPDPPKPITPEGPVLMTSLTDPAVNAVDAASLPSAQPPAAAASDAPASADRRVVGEEGPSAQEGVAIQASDFGPWMGVFKRRLSRNWVPPRGERRRKVTLLVEVARDGSVKAMQVDQSSGEPRSDEAAMNAVRVSAPFEPLPAAYTGETVPILFTFDYTVFGDSRRP